MLPALHLPSTYVDYLSRSYHILQVLRSRCGAVGRAWTGSTASRLL